MMRLRSAVLLIIAASCPAQSPTAVLAAQEETDADSPLDIGDRRELFVDHHLIDRLDGVELVLHRPVRREVVFRTDAPWEGNGSAYQSLVRDGDKFRMYYRGGHHPASIAYETKKNSWETLCLAESRDGIHWTRPVLNLVELEGSTENNVVLDANMVRQIEGSPAHTAVFLDANPDCPPDERYKLVIVGRKPHGLYLMTSPDGLRFRLKSDKPLTTTGAFDSQNLMFWDPVAKLYREYHRQFDNGVRGIMTAASADPASFPEPRWLEYPGAPVEALYTNQIQPYYRAPHILIGFPMRYTDRGWSPSMRALPGLEEREYRAARNPRYGTAVTDALLMTSRDGVVFHRWGEAFIRPGPSKQDSWVYGDNFVFWGMLQTDSQLRHAPDEISLYATEGYWQGDATSVRRYTLRLDGFVSASAGAGGGTLRTRPFVFDGTHLELNMATSGAGSIRIELLDEAGNPIDGFTREDCSEIFGDDVARTVSWADDSRLADLAGKTIRMNIELADADLYSFRFYNDDAAAAEQRRSPRGVPEGVEKPLRIAPRPGNGRNSEGDFIKEPTRKVGIAIPP